MKMRRCCTSFVEAHKEVYKGRTAWDKNTFWYVGCPDCEASTAWHSSRRRAMEAWNNEDLIAEVENLDCEPEEPESGSGVDVVRATSRQLYRSLEADALKAAEKTLAAKYNPMDTIGIDRGATLDEKTGAFFGIDRTTNETLDWVIQWNRDPKPSTQNTWKGDPNCPRCGKPGTLLLESYVCSRDSCGSPPPSPPYEWKKVSESSLILSRPGHKQPELLFPEAGYYFTAGVTLDLTRDPLPGFDEYMSPITGKHDVRLERAGVYKRHSHRSWMEPGSFAEVGFDDLVFHWSFGLPF